MRAPGLSPQEKPCDHPAVKVLGRTIGKRGRSPSEVPEPTRKSRRLQERQLHKQSASAFKTLERQSLLPSPPSSKSLKPDPLHATTPSSPSFRDRKRRAEAAFLNTATQSQTSAERYLKRQNTNTHACVLESISDRTCYWTNEWHWPKELFEPHPMDRPTAKRCRSVSSDQEIDIPSSASSDQKSRESKSAPYRDSRYPMLLEIKGSFMRDSEAGMLPIDRELCRTLLAFKQRPPSNTLFDSPFFSDTIDKIQDENETRVIRDIGSLITPSAECLATQGMRRLRYLKESTNAGWNHSIPVEGTRPQPDFAVGFARHAFSDDQLEKLGFDLFNKTFYTATFKIFFPFFTSEVKCGQQALEIAERQNTHSMTIALRGVIKLYQSVGRASELHRRVLGFSISHNHQSVRIFAHYSEIDKTRIKYHRHLLKEISLLYEHGKNKWAAYQFTRNIYGTFVPLHLRRIKSALDQLPDPAVRLSTSTQQADNAGSSQEPVQPNATLMQEIAFKKLAPPRRGSAPDLRLQLERQIQQSEQIREEDKQEREKLRQEARQLREVGKQREDRLLEELKQEREDKGQLRAQLSQVLTLLAKMEQGAPSTHMM